MRKYKMMHIASLFYDKPLKIMSDFSLLSYEDQQKRLFENFFVYGDGFSKGMRLLGHESFEIVADAEMLQKTWAQENNFNYNEHSWHQDIILEQIRHYKPEIIYFQDIHALHYDNFKILKDKFPFIKLIVIFRGFPGIDPLLIKVLSFADLIFVGSPSLYYKLQEKKINCHLMYHFFDDNIYDFVDFTKISQKYDFTFIGSSGYGYGMEHLPRYAALLQLLKRTDLQLWVDEKKNLKTKWILFKKLIRYLGFSKRINIFGNFFDLVEKINYFCKNNNIDYLKKNELIFMKPLSKIFPNKCQPSVFGLEMNKLLAESKITFNKHTLAAKNYADNMRLFQATGMGSCLVTENSPNIKDLFDVDNEIITYSTIDECIEKVNYLLKNEKKRKIIAKNGQTKTLKNHSYKVRCRQMDEIFQKSIR